MYRSDEHPRCLHEIDFLPVVVGVVCCSCIVELLPQQLPSLLLPLLVHLQRNELALVRMTCILHMGTPLSASFWWIFWGACCGRIVTPVT